MTALYALAKEYQGALNDALMQEELSLDQVQALNKIEGDFEDKAIAIATYIQNFEAEAEAVRAAVLKMKQRAERLDNKAAMLSKYLCFNLKMSGLKEIRKNPHFVIKVKQNPPKVVIDNEDLLDTKYLKKKIVETLSIEKSAIMTDIKSGLIVRGAHLESDVRLEIK